MKKKVRKKYLYLGHNGSGHYTFIGASPLPPQPKLPQLSRIKARWRIWNMPVVRIK